MKIQYCSDLHLEFRENMEFLKKNPIQPIGEVLLLSGDIVLFTLMGKHGDFFDYVSDHFETVYWVPGNHEYYHTDLAEKRGTLFEKIKSNVFIVNNQVVQHQNVKFIFSTLWTKISPEYQWNIQQQVSDFHVIKYQGEPFTPDQYNQLHEESKQFIMQKAEQEFTGKTLVVTHHVPTFLHYPEKYKGDVLNEAFAVELHDFINNSNIDYWLFGHHHINIPEFNIGKTKMINNQLGYVKYREHLSFKRNVVIDINKKRT